MGLFALTFTPKLILSLTLIIEDIFRLTSFISRKISRSPKTKKYLPERRKTITILGFGLASIPFLGIIEGIVWGKFDFKVKKNILTLPNLPSSFDGYKIIQISDMHLGSFYLSDKDKIIKGLKLINEQNADLIVFTGDMVNNYADEMLPWLDLLKTIQAKDGVYAILGNHDYGIYVYQDNIEAQQKNIEQLGKYYTQLNWNLLNNRSVKIEKEGQYINLIGVENWGAGSFSKHGDLKKATEYIKASDFNILLSHDPSHFDAEVKESLKNIVLTLSGHTHGMQFGVEIPELIKWSPIKYRYPKWVGLYQSLGKYLYVNRGFGYIGFPGRVGIFPEITVLELRK